MLYGFSAVDVVRLRKMLQAFERGSIRIDPPSNYLPDYGQQDTFLAETTGSIPAGEVGTANLVNLDTTLPTPVATTNTDIPTIDVYNPGSSLLAAGTYLVALEPSQGYYVPANAGGGGSSTISYLSSTASNTSLTTSWANTGLTVSLLAGSTWLLVSQLNATITASSSGGGDSVSFRFYDGSAVAGNPVELCNVPCATITGVDAAALVVIYQNTGGTSVTVTVQGIINTSSGSTGQFLGSGSGYGSYLAAIRLA